MVFLSVQPKFRTAPAFPTVQNIKYATHKPFNFHVLNLRNFKTSEEIFTPIIQRSPCRCNVRFWRRAHVMSSNRSRNRDFALGLANRLNKKAFILAYLL